MTSIWRAGIVALVVLTWAVSSVAQVEDHLKCYKVKDPLKIAGTADLDTSQFGVDPGCTILKAKKARLFCVPATKTNVSVVDKSTGNPITPRPVGGSDPGDRLCYKVKCERAVPDQEVTDQFGTRTVAKLQAALVCTPAVKGGMQGTTTTAPGSTSTSTTSATTSTTATTTTTLRFVDNGNSITDNLTGLQWVETNDADGVENFLNPQDADNMYSWSSSGSAADGTVFRDYVQALNACTSSGPPPTPVFEGFAAHCDWRLPTPAELQTILLAPFPCGASPCIDPIFGPTAPSPYWTSNTFAGGSGNAWFIDFNNGSAFVNDKTVRLFARAVRGGS